MIVIQPSKEMLLWSTDPFGWKALQEETLIQHPYQKERFRAVAYADIACCEETAA